MLWLQSAETFADIRIPLMAAAPPSGHGPAGLFHRRRAFAGVARWNPPSMVWEHALDSDRNPGTDVGVLDLSTPGWVYEDGTVDWDGGTVPFREEWELISTPGAPVHVAETTRRISVTVGRWRIDIADGRPDAVFRADRLELCRGEWRVVGTLTVDSRRT